MLPRILATTIGRHRLKRPRSANSKPHRLRCRHLPFQERHIHCDNSFFPARTPFGVPRCFYINVSADQSVFREGSEKARKGCVSPACFLFRNRIAFRPAAASGSGHCPVKKAAVPAFPLPCPIRRTALLLYKCIRGSKCFPGELERGLSQKGRLSNVTLTPARCAGIAWGSCPFRA